MTTHGIAAPIVVLATVLACGASANPAAADIVSDPLTAQSWHLTGDGPMGITSAWERSTGGEVIVAVLDSGADLRHPDLVANLWTNPGEIPGNGVDDDADGFVDDVHGADVVNRDGDPSDDNGHGTHVTGIVGARGDNGVGASGIAWQVRLMPVKVLDGRAIGSSENVARGLRYAVARGARIVNVSVAGPRPSPPLRAAVEAARRAGVLIVAAAGNAGRDLGAFPSYPVSLKEDNVLGVAATRPDGGLASVSNRGNGAELTAPGTDILSTARGGGYELRTGTSAAAPMVAGAAALVASVLPNADYRTLGAALLGGARPPTLLGGTRALDAGGAVRTAASGAAALLVDRSRLATPPDRVVLGRGMRAVSGGKSRAVKHGSAPVRRRALASRLTRRGR